MGTSKSVEDTEKIIASVLSTSSVPNSTNGKSFRVYYAVHERSESSAEHTKFIGAIAMRSLEGGGLDLSYPLVPKDDPALLIMELGYQYLPPAWGKGYAGEALNAVFEACTRRKEFWGPYEKVYCRVIVNDGNPASMRVMQKMGMRETGVYKWTGKMFLAGKWRYEDDLHIFGRYLLGAEDDAGAQERG
jgi:RimJ/RimL family protein N-acetyltransferase